MKVVGIGLALGLCVGTVALAQELSLSGYRVLYAQPVAGAGMEVVAKATAVNSGAAIAGASAIVESSSSGTVVEAGTLNFGAIDAGGTAESINTFVVRTGSAGSINLSDLRITFRSTTNPIPTALAGIHRVVKEGAPVMLSGGGSTSASGRPLRYVWRLVSQPPGSRAALSDPFGVQTALTPDAAGQYVAELVVHDGMSASAVASVVIGASVKVPPTSSAEMRPAESRAGSLLLSGAASSDANGLPLTFEWTLLSAPANSQAALQDASSVHARLLPDEPGQYVAQLIVHDEHGASTPTIVAINSPVAEPRANPGRGLKVELGRQVHLDGSGSTDPQRLPLTYHWDLITAPAGSTATLSDASSVTPSFVADKAGTYVAQLVVHNGTFASRASTVTVATQFIAPIANAGPNQLAGAGTAVQLDGSGSTDENGLTLAYQWNLVSIPQGSGATLSSTSAVRPVFTVDVPGTYVAQLIVSDNAESSAPAQVIVSTSAIPPTANSGPAQKVSTGSAVTLNGTGSSDPNGLPLTYLWTLLSKPNGSGATLGGANTASPGFTADVAGNYVAQLIVSDSDYSSTPATVLITTGDLPPIANAGTSDTVPLPGGVVTLNGTGSSDPQGLSLTYSWSFLTIPTNSSAVLSNPNATSPTFVADLPGIYIAQLIVNDGVQSSQPVTVVIQGQFPPAINVTLENSSLITYSKTVGDVNISNPATNSGSAGCNGQVVEISLDDASLGALSAPSVCIPVGLQDAAFSLTTSGNTGSTTITGFAPNFQTGTTYFNVSPRSLSMFFDTTTVGQGRVANGTLMLATPAPSGGVTINLASSAPLVANLSTSTVSIAAGNAVGTFQVSAQSPGQTTITATTVQAGYTSASQSITVLAPGLTITIPHNVVVGPGQSLPFPVSIGAAATSAVTVNLAVTGGSGSATFSPASVVIPAGSTSPANEPNIVGGGLGPITVTGSASGYAPDIEQENVTAKLSFHPTKITVLTSNTATLTLNSSYTAPSGGLPVSLTLSKPTLATVPATVTIPEGSTTVQVTVTGVAAGTTKLTASGTGLTAASATIVVEKAPAITFSGSCPTSMGLNAASASVCIPVLAVAAPSGGETVTITSLNPALVTLTLDPTTTGSGSVTLDYPGGSTYPSNGNGGFYLAALAGSGTTKVTASGAGYSTETLDIKLMPSGFTVTGGTTTTTLSPPTEVDVNFVSLDPATRAVTGYPSLRPGAAPVTVNLTNSNAATGTLSASSITLTPGNEYEPVNYSPAAVGASTISITTPSGYTKPSAGTSTKFTVSLPDIRLQGNCPASLGLNAVSTGCVPILGAPAPTGGVALTVTSSNPAAATLTPDPTMTGSQSLTLEYAGGTTYPTSTGFYVAGLVNTGTVTMTLSAPGYKNTTLKVKLTPSGFTVSGGIQTTAYSSPTEVDVNFVSLDPKTLSVTGYPNLRAGAAAVTINLTNDNTTTGTLSPTSVTITAGNEYAPTYYTPLAAGTSNIGIAATPSGYSQPSSGTTTQFTVAAPNLNFTGSCPSTLGVNAITSAVCAPILGAPAPAGGVAVTVSAGSQSLVTFTLNPATTGGQGVTLNYAGGTTYPSNGGFYMAALAGSGTVTVTASAPGYNSNSFPVTLTPSGFTVTGGRKTTTFATPTEVDVNFVSLDPSSLSPIGYPTLRPGAAPVTVNLNNDNTTTGTLGASSLTITPGNEYAPTTYTPAQNGTSKISIASTPAGYTKPSSGTSTVFTVVAPAISFGGSCSSTMGMNSINYGTCVAILGAPAPPGGEVVTISSGSPSLATVTLDQTAVGSQTVVLNYAAGSTYPTNGGFYVAALASSGSVKISAAAPGFNSASFTVQLTPSGFTVTGGRQTTTFSLPTEVDVNFVSLDPVSLNPTGYPNLRPGAPAVTVNLTNDNSAVGGVSPTAVTITPGNEYAATYYSPMAPGTSNIGIAATPAGYTTPFSGTSTQFTVVAPNISFQGSCPSTLGLNAISPYQTCTPILGAPAPAGGEAVTISSSSSNLATVTTDASAVGGQSVVLYYSAGNTYPTNGGFYLAGLASSGTSTISATAPGFNQASFAVTLIPSGFTITGGSSTTTFSAASEVDVNFVSLDPVSLNPTGYPNLRPGAPPVTLTMTNDNTGAGNIAPTSVTITPGNEYAATFYTPVAAGTSNIAIAATPAGYTTPFSGTSTQFVVTAPNAGVNPVTVGHNLMTTTYGVLAQGAPSDNYAVTISVSDSTQLMLSATGTDLGTSSLTFTLSQGQTRTPQFWVYGIGAPGAATVNISSAGENGTGTITIDPSGFVFQNQNFSTTVGATPTTLYIMPAALDPQYLSQVAVQQLRPGMTNTQVTVTLTDQPSQGSGPSQVGQITVNPVVFNGADNPNQQITSFQAIGVGQTLLQLTSPGFSASSSEVTATVSH